MAAFQSELARRGRSAFLLGISVLLASTAAYYTLGCLTGMNARFGKELLSLDDDRWEVTECLYASAVTLTTVGYSDILGTESLELWRDAAGRHRWVSATDPHEDPGFDPATAVRVADWSAWTRLLTAAHVIVGIAFFMYVIEQVTSFFVEGEYERLRSDRRRQRLLARMRDHVVVCGAGETALHVVEALRQEGAPCVVIEHEPGAEERFLTAQPDVPLVHGDATEEGVLLSAGLARARGLVTTLGDDGMNVVTAVTAHQLRPRLRVVSRGFGAASARRLVATGCAVVNPARLAGLRVASELVRPTSVAFIDEVLSGRTVRVEEMRVGAEADVRRVGDATGAGRVVLALERGAGAILYNPPDAEPLAEGDELVAIGTPEALAALRARLGVADEAVIERPDVDLLAAAPSSHPAAAAERDHFILCGAGETGVWVAREIHATRRPLVAVDRRPEALEALRAEIPGLRVVQGDVEDPETLQAAGVEAAAGVAATLQTDNANLLAVVTALQAKPGLRVVSLAWDDGAERRLRRAGARVVSQGRIGGRRVAAEMLRPHLTGFLERMLVDERAARVESVVVSEGGPVAGKTLADADIPGRTGMRPLALLAPDTDAFDVDPDAGAVLAPGTRIIVLGDPDELARLVALVGRVE